MPSPKILTKEMILRAQKNALSNMAAARYLSASYGSYKKYAKMYIDEATGKTLFDIHLNRSGKGIPKFLSNKGKEPPLMDLIEGKIDISSFKPSRIKMRLIQEGYIDEECKECGFRDRRILDYKIPLLLNFKDGNKKNYRKENIELLCYNCYFLQEGDVLSEKQVQGAEDHVVKYEGDFNWELDDYHMERLRELGLKDSEADDLEKYIGKM